MKSVAALIGAVGNIIITDGIRIGDVCRALGFEGAAILTGKKRITNANAVTVG